MNATSRLSNYRQSPRKVRLVANLVRGMTVELALLELTYADKRAAQVFMKLINSAVANAKASGMTTANLVVKELRVDKGVVMKRSMPRAHGRAFPIMKRTSHILCVLEEKEPKVKSAKKGKVKTAETIETTEKKPEAKAVTAKKTKK